MMYDHQVIPGTLRIVPSGDSLVMYPSTELWRVLQDIFINAGVQFEAYLNFRSMTYEVTLKQSELGGLMRMIPKYSDQPFLRQMLQQMASASRG